MGLSETIAQNRKKLLESWHDAALRSYPKQSRSLLGAKTDRFSNPLGFTLQEGVERIFDFLFCGGSEEEMEVSLARMVKLKAVQDPGSNEALSFVLVLKPILRQFVGAEGGKFKDVSELLQIEDRIDQVLVRAHRIFVDARELIAQLKVNEVMRKTHSLRKIADCT